MTTPALRALRLWHWTQAMSARQFAQRAFDDQAQADFLNRWADFHIKQVQALNDLFPAGDTAERDARGES